MGRKMYGDEMGMETDVMGMVWGQGQMGRGWGVDGDGYDGDGVGMGRNLWGWGGYGENKLSPCSSVLSSLVQTCSLADCIILLLFTFL